MSFVLAAFGVTLAVIAGYSVFLGLRRAALRASARVARDAAEEAGNEP